MGTAFVYHCHVNKARGEGPNKMWSVLANQRHRVLRGDECYLDGHTGVSNILYQNISTPTSEFYECKHPFSPAHKPARGYTYFFTKQMISFQLQSFWNKIFCKGYIWTIPINITKNCFCCFYTQKSCITTKIEDM